MSKAAIHQSKPMPKTFTELNALLPLRPINDEIDLANAYEVMDRLAVIERPTKDQRDYLETLVLLTEAFDKDENEAALAEASKIGGVELLKYLMTNVEMTQAQLGNLLGISPAAASMVLSGARAITADHARSLGKHFKMQAGAFL